jgi:hypothetical protein
MFALRDFPYENRETRQQVVIKRGERIDAEVLAKHGCDIEKLERVKFVAQGDAPDVSLNRIPKKRGRPKKS